MTVEKTKEEEEVGGRRLRKTLEEVVALEVDIDKKGEED